MINKQSGLGAFLVTRRRPVAIKYSEQGVQPARTSACSPCPVDALDWDDLRFFRQVANSGSFRAAAEAERVSVNTVRARVEKLEAGYGAPLLRRTRTGCTTTDAGEEVLRIAQDMRSATLASRRKAAGDVLVAPGEVRLSCSEGLGLLWLTPRLSLLSETLGGLTANLRLDYDLSRDRTPEVDIGLTFTPPGDPDMIICKLATLHYMVFASGAYLRANGTPATLDEMKRHRIVEQVTPGVNSWLETYFLGTDRPPGLVPIRTNSSLSQLWAVANGAGIAPMPTYVRAVTRNVLPVDPPLNLRFDLYCAFHPSGRGSPAIEATLAWLRRCFDPILYPWFRSEFVHPNDFVRADQDGRVITLFDNLIDPVLPDEG
jgi:DNA-binding transcriptional LysR family regulator